MITAIALISGALIGLVLAASVMRRALSASEQQKLDRSYMRALREGQERGQ
jgi:hypothetical protein